MKRVDFDPNGERNPQNRGNSGYERISWDEALDIVASEIKRQRSEHGPGAMAIYHSSHHQWGNVGYYLSALQRFGNLVGFTRMHHNPDSWEGWYWGAHAPLGQQPAGRRRRQPTARSRTACKECELIVFWSSDPETTSGVYAGSEGTQRRLWAKELGIEFVHIDPHCTPTAQLLGGSWIPIRPGTDAALAIAIMYVWITRGPLRQGIRRRSARRASKPGATTCSATTTASPKTPEWQEAETGVPGARGARARARVGHEEDLSRAPAERAPGSAARAARATGAQWARSMILMMAMQGWGKPGINFGNLQCGTPLDFSFYFPGYAEGGISGDLVWTASAISNYQRMPHVLTMNPVKQMIPRQRLPEAIIEGQARAICATARRSKRSSRRSSIRCPGYSRVHMIYRYGGSYFGTIANSSRFVEAYRHPSLEFVVNQSIWFEGEAKFADVILPACTKFERWDIGEWANAGGYGHHAQGQLNHRVVVLQHKCIEPLGESKSDYQIFLDILSRMGLGALYSEGCSELDWVKRVFDSSDLPQHVSWREFLSKGYFVVPAGTGSDPRARVLPLVRRGPGEGRPRAASAAVAIHGRVRQGPADAVGQDRVRRDDDRARRPGQSRAPGAQPLHPLVGRARQRRARPAVPAAAHVDHSRYSFHTDCDGKDSAINDIAEHRVRIDGYYYWVLRINADDAAKRGIRHHDLVRVYNDRGAVICAADVSPLVAPGVVKAYQASANFDPIDDGERVTDRGGCVNMLTPRRPQIKGTEGMAPNSCLVELERWNAGRGPR